MSKFKKISLYILSTALIVIASFSISVSAASSYDTTPKNKSSESLIQIGTEKVRVTYTTGGWFAWDNAKLNAEANGTNATIELYHKDNNSNKEFVKDTKYTSKGSISLGYTSNGTMYLHEGSYGKAKTNSHLVKLTMTK